MTQLPTALLTGLFGGTVAPPSVVKARREADVAAAAEKASPDKTNPTAAIDTTKGTLTGAASKGGDSVKLSPEAQALATVTAVNAKAKPATTATTTTTTPGAASATKELTEAEKKARDAFDEVAKKFFGELLGFKGSDVRKFEINDAARRYLVRNTVLGALAPAGLRESLGIDKTGSYKAEAAPGKRELAKLSFFDRQGKELAVVAFDAEALEKFSRRPRYEKDLDNDGRFTPVDLFPRTKEIPKGEIIKYDAGQRFTKLDRDEGKRFIIKDDQGDPLVYGRFDEKDDKAQYRTISLTSGLLQFAGFARPATLV